MQDENTVDSRQANQMFTQGASAQQSHASQDVQQQSMTADLGFDIPIDLVPVPSFGLCYGVDTPLCNVETLQIRAMTSREEDILTSQAFIKNGTVITQLLKSSIVEKIDPKQLLIGDRTAILVALRITGYGPDYVVDSECPACREIQAAPFDLQNLPIKFLETKPDVPNTNAFTVALPVSKVRVTFKLMTGADEEDLLAERFAKKKKIKTQLDNHVTSRWRRQIIAVNGKNDGNIISNFAQRMPARDSKFLQKYIASIEPGITMKAPLKCTSCEVESEVSVEIGPKFFWPDD